MSEINFFKNIFLNSSEPICILNTDRIINNVNDAFLIKFGSAQSSFLGHSLNEFFDFNNIRNQKFDGGGDLWSGEVYTIFGNLKGLYSKVELIRVTDKHGDKSIEHGYVLKFIDDSAELIINSRRLIHDMNNMLTSAAGHMLIIEDLIKKNIINQSAFEPLSFALRHSIKIAKQLLNPVGKVEADSCSLSDIVKNSIELIKPELSNIKIDLSLVAKDIKVQGSEIAVGQVVVNLIKNSIEALISGGVIRVGVEKIKLDQALVDCHPHPVCGKLTEGDYALFTVFDDGEGVPEELRNKIFEPYFTTKKRKGTGLGLPSVILEIKNLGGSLFFSSEKDKGTIFSVYLRLSEEETIEEEEVEQRDRKSTEKIAVEPAKLLKNNQPVVLVIDDEAAVRLVIEKSMERLDYQVLTAENGEHGVEVYSKHKDIISLVILDMIMPKLSGDMVFKELKKINPDVKVLLSTGFASDKKTQEILNNGGLGIINKPFTFDELSSEVKKWIS